MGFLELSCGVTVFLFAVYYYLINYYYPSKFEFWKKRGVPGPKPVPFFGTMKDIILRKTIPIKYYTKIYNEYIDAPLVGLYDQTTLVLMIHDPELIKDILITDSASFSGRGIPSYEKAEPIMHNIVNMKGEEALRLRTKLSTFFTPSKLKVMFSSFSKRSKIFQDRLDMLIMRNEYIECNELITRLTIDYIANSILFNYDIINIGDEKSEFLYYFMKLNGANLWRDTIKTIFPKNKLYNLIGYYLFDNAKITQYFKNFVRDMKNYKKEHGSLKHDIIDVFTEFKPIKNSNEELVITDENKDYQIASFFLASFDTASVTISNALFELALKHSVQDKLREEIKEAHNNGEITFDDVYAMSYLDAVLKETLRKHPIIDAIRRQASSSYTFRNFQITIPKDTILNIPVYGIHHDPKIYPNPHDFEPERFIGEMANSKHSMHYIPFGHGSRNCIARRLGILEVKMGLITILRNYKVDICEKTEFEYDGELRIQRPKALYLKITKVD